MCGLYKGLILSVIKFSRLRSLLHITGTYQKHVSKHILSSFGAGTGDTNKIAYRLLLLSPNVLEVNCYILILSCVLIT